MVLKIISFAAAAAFMTPSICYADTYDSATNQLTIPSIVVGGVTFTNVVVTVGSIVSYNIATSSSAAPAATSTCTLNTRYHGAVVTLTAVDAAHIAISLQAPSSVTFSVGNLNIVQNGQSGSIQPDIMAAAADFSFPYATDRSGGGTYGAGSTTTLAVVAVPSWFQPGTYTLTDIWNDQVTCVW